MKSMMLGSWKKKGGWTRLELPSVVVAVVVDDEYMPRREQFRAWPRSKGGCQ